MMKKTMDAKLQSTCSHNTPVPAAVTRFYPDTLTPLACCATSPCSCASRHQGSAYPDHDAAWLPGQRARQPQALDAAQRGLRQRLHPRVGLPRAAEDGAVREAAGALPVPLVVRPVPCSPGRWSGLGLGSRQSKPSPNLDLVTGMPMQTLMC